MDNKLTKQNIIDMFEQVKLVFDEKEKELCEMDAALGDGDLGLTMKRGFECVWDFLKTSEESGIGKAISKAGMRMSSVAPSTMGTLLASGLMQAGMKIGDKTELDTASFVDFLVGLSEGIERRGKCSRGQCTVLDCFGPAADAAKKAFEDNNSIKDIIKKAYAGAEIGTKSTADMKPVYGRAAVLQSKSSGIIDQGAYAGLCFYDGIKKYFEKI